MTKHDQCRCGQPLQGAAAFIGVCIWCVAQSTQAPRVAIPAPAYRGDDGDAERDALPRPD